MDRRAAPPAVSGAPDPRPDPDGDAAAEGAATAGTGGVRPVPWGVRDVAPAVVLLVLIFGGLLLGVTLIVRWAGVRPPPGEFVGGTIVSTLLTDGILIGLILIFGVRRGGRWADFGFRRFSISAVKLAGYTLMLGFLVNIVYALALQALDLERLSGPSARELLPLFGTGQAGLIVALILAAVLAPLVEEAFFRGFVFGGLQQRLGPIGAGIVSALVFAIVHLHPATIIPIFALGCLLAWLYRRTGSLWPPIMVHSAYNATALIAAFATLGRSP